MSALILTTLIILATAGGAFNQAAAQEALVGDRPDFTESSVTVPFGMIQVETGYSLSRMEDVREHTLGEMLIRAGAGSRFELRFGLNSYLLTRGGADDLDGVEDMALGFKLNIFEGSSTFNLARPSVAIVASASVPTGSGVYREKKTQPCVKLAAAWDVTERFAVSSNIGYQHSRDSGIGYDQFSGSVSFGYSLSDLLGCYAEVYRFMPNDRGGPDVNYVNSGVTYLISDNFQLDARIGSALNGPDPNFYLGFGAVALFNLRR